MMADLGHGPNIQAYRNPKDTYGYLVQTEQPLEYSDPEDKNCWRSKVTTTMYKLFHLILLLGLLSLASTMPITYPSPVIEPNELYVKSTPDSALLARDPVEGLELAKRSPILAWTWFNGGGKNHKRSPILAWTWFNGGGKNHKRSSISE
jgi:hypothetical protein